MKTYSLLKDEFMPLFDPLSIGLIYILNGSFVMNLRAVTSIGED